MRFVAAVVLLLAAGAAASRAQGPASGGATDDARAYRTTAARIAIGRSVHVPANEEVTDAVVVVGGSVRIDGRVRDGIVVIGGNVDAGPTADVRGEVVIIGGRLSAAPGARVRARVSDVTIGNWRSWRIAGLRIPVIELGEFGRWLSLAGTAFRLGLLALLMAATLVLARAPVARIGRSAGASPGKAFVLGLAAEVFFIPALVIASVALIITLIGIPVVIIMVPLALLLAFVALLLGFTAIACRLGEWVQDLLGWRAHSAVLAMSMGLLLIAAPTIAARSLGVAPGGLPLAGTGLLGLGLALEFVIWTIGLGATLMTGFGRWSTVPPPLPRLPQPTVLPATH